MDVPLLSLQIPLSGREWLFDDARGATTRTVFAALSTTGVGVAQCHYRATWWLTLASRVVEDLFKNHVQCSFAVICS